MEDRVRVVPLLCQSRSSETNALADRADAHRNVDTRGIAGDNLHSVAGHIVEAGQASGHPLRTGRQVPQFVAAAGIGRRAPLHPAGLGNKRNARKALLHRV